MKDKLVNLDGVKVLVVDDIAENRRILIQTLECEGYSVSAAPSGEIALKIASRDVPDLILLDLVMPGLNGFETCLKLKEDQVTRDVPVIFITANDETESVLEGFRVGAVDFISKPFKTQEVLVRAETHLKIARLTSALNKRNDDLHQLNCDLETEIVKRERAEQSLSLVDEDQPERFHTGGTLPQEASSYVERQSDRELLESLVRGEFCYVLTSRQMGKSSLMVRTAKRLQEKQFKVAALDLTALGQNVDAEQWYGGLLAEMGWQLGLEDPLDSFWQQHLRLSPVQRFFSAIREVVLSQIVGRVCIFVDELDMVCSLSFATDEFFAAIREFYNHRSEDSKLNRVSFCLLGVATPRELIEDDRMTPFNIGSRVELEDFTRAELTPLAYGLGRSRKIALEIIDRIYYWASGHPYLTQKLCKHVLENEAVQSVSGVDDLCARLFLNNPSLEQDDNLLFVRERLLRGASDLGSLLETYEKILKSDSADCSIASSFFPVLRLSGIVRVVEGRLTVRNRIYKTVFDEDWIRTQLEMAGLNPNDLAAT